MNKVMVEMNKLVNEFLSSSTSKTRGTSSWYIAGVVGNKKVCYTKRKTGYQARWGFWSWIQTHYKNGIIKRTKIAKSGSIKTAKQRAYRLLSQLQLNKTGGKKKMELEWQKARKIPDGSHTGVIVKIEYRDNPYEYTDVFIKPDDADFDVRYGCPTLLSENSKLGKLLSVFGASYAEGSKLDPEEILLGKKVIFMTVMKKAKDGKEYAEIVDDSIKPIPGLQQ